MEWDVRISSSRGQSQIAIPRQLGDLLRKKGLNRTVMRVTDEGILLLPYHTDEPAVTKALRPVSAPWLTDEQS